MKITVKMQNAMTELVFVNVKKDFMDQNASMLTVKKKNGVFGQRKYI